MLEADWTIIENRKKSESPHLCCDDDPAVGLPLLDPHVWKPKDKSANDLLKSCTLRRADVLHRVDEREEDRFGILANFMSLDWKEFFLEFGESLSFTRQESYPHVADPDENFRAVLKENLNLPG